MNKILDYIIYQDDAWVNYINKGEEYEKYSKQGFDVYNELLGKLNGEQAELFKNFADLMATCEGCAVDEYLKAGIKFGVRFAMECLSE